MLTDISLMEDEVVIKESSFKYSLIMFFLKSKLVLTNKRLVGKINNTFWIIPVGTKNVTYLLENIVEVRMEKILKRNPLIFSICTLLGGLVLVHDTIHIGILLILMGKIGIINSKQNIITAKDRNGGIMSCSISRMNVGKANEFIGEINRIAAERQGGAV